MYPHAEANPESADHFSVDGHVVGPAGAAGSLALAEGATDAVAAAVGAEVLGAVVKGAAADDALRDEVSWTGAGGSLLQAATAKPRIVMVMNGGAEERIGARLYPMPCNVANVFFFGHKRGPFLALGAHPIERLAGSYLLTRLHRLKTNAISFQLSFAIWRSVLPLGPAACAAMPRRTRRTLRQTSRRPT